MELVEGVDSHVDSVDEWEEIPQLGRKITLRPHHTMTGALVMVDIVNKVGEDVHEVDRLELCDVPDGVLKNM